MVNKKNLTDKEVTTIRTQLKDYGGHLPKCAKWWSWSSRDYLDGDCTCGWGEIEKGLQ